MSVNMHAVLVGLLSVTHTRAQAEHAAREVLNQHAYELAKQIRETAANWGGVPGMDARDAADLIEPAVTGRDAEGNPA